MSLPVFELRLLGGVDLRAPGGELACGQILAQSRRTALLAYLRLAARDRLASRDTLHGIFWPELPQSRARRALNQSLYFLRHRMGDDVFLTDGPSLIGVDPARVSCDADEFETRVQADDLAAALDSYSGVLFDGFHLSGVPDFERWLDRERERLRGVARTAAWTLIERHRERRELVEAIHWGRWLRQFEPYDEALMNCLLDLLEAAGDRSAIKREMRSFETRLQQDLGYTPGEAMVERVETILTAGNHRVVDPSVYARVDEVTHTTVEQESIGGAGRQAKPRPHRWWPAIPVGLAAIVAAIALWTRTVSSELNPPPANGRRVAVLPFRNETGDSTLDYLERVAADWTRQRLVQMGLVEVVPSIITFQTVLDIPSVPASESSSRATSESFAVATATGASVVVLGSITRTGDTLIFSGSAEDPNLGRVVGVVKPVRVTRDEPLEGIEQVAQHLAGTMAALVSPNMAGWAEKGSRPPTLEAYRRFDAAMERFLSASSISAGAPEAGAAFAEAALADEGFTSPLVWSIIANMYHDQWREAAATSEVLAHHLADLPAWDRAVLEYAQARLSDDLPAAYVALRHVVELVSAPEWRELLALYAFFNRRPREALSEFHRQNPIPSRLVGNRRNWEASAYHLMEDYETELRMTQRDGLSIRAKEGIELRARVGLGETR